VVQYTIIRAYRKILKVNQKFVSKKIYYFYFFGVLKRKIKIDKKIKIIELF